MGDLRKCGDVERSAKVDLLWEGERPSRESMGILRSGIEIPGYP